MQRNRLLPALGLFVAAGLSGCRVNPVDIDRAIEHYVAGRLAMEQHDYERALDELREAIRANPRLSVAHATVGDIHRKRENYVLAAGAYEEACEANPYAFRPHYNLGVTYQLLADRSEAAATAADYIRRAVRVYLRAITLRSSDFDANLNLSACYFRQGKFDLAEQYCKAAVELAPSNPHGRSNLGIIYDAQNRPYDAIAAYKASLELDTRQPKLLLNMGSTYMQLRRLNDALNAFQMAAREDPSCAEAYVQIGACQYHLKNWEESAAAYQRAVKIDPNCAQGFRGLGVVYMTRYIMEKAGEEMRNKALDAWHRSLELDSNQPDLLRLVKKYRPEITGPPL